LQEDDPSGHIWQHEKLHNLCPACFSFEKPQASTASTEEEVNGTGTAASAEHDVSGMGTAGSTEHEVGGIRTGSPASATDRAILISLDGNMQHTRFRNRGNWEFEKLPIKLFVDYGRREFSRAAHQEVDQPAVDNDTPCGSQFKATKGWNKTEASTATKKHLDETGLVVATCFHGIALRFLNMHGTGERHTHAEAILRSLLSEVDDVKDFKICYDVACVFDPAIKKMLADKDCNIQVRIGRFHLYAHGISCQINYSTLRTEGYGLMVGEEPEQVWYGMNHLVRPGRVSSGPRRSQSIDVFGLHNAFRMQSMIGLNLQRRFKKMQEIEKDARKTLERVLAMTVFERKDKAGIVHPAQRISVEYLEAQIEDQIAYYKSYRYVPPRTSTYRILPANLLHKENHRGSRWTIFGTHCKRKNAWHSYLQSRMQSRR
jgi:hypothetical protein